MRWMRNTVGNVDLWFSLALALVLLVPLAASEPVPASLLDAGAPAGIAGLVDPPDLGLTQAILARPGWTVHAVVRSPAQRDTLIAEAAKAGFAHRFSVALWEGGRLPYAPRLLSLLAVDRGVAGAPDDAEIVRVVAPLGQVLSTKGGAWKAEVMPLPATMDTWPQWRRDAGRSRSSLDQLAGPSEVLHWQAGLAHGETACLVTDGILITQQQVPGRQQPAIFRGYNAFSGVWLWEHAAVIGDVDRKAWKTQADWMWGERVGFAATSHAGALILATQPPTLVDIRSGTVKGTLPAEGPVARVWGQGDALIAVSSTSLTVHDAKTLAVRWRRDCTPYDLVCEHDTIFYLDVEENRRALVACALADGSERWRQDLSPWWVDDYRPSGKEFQRKEMSFSPVRIVMAVPGRVLVRSAKDLGHLLCLDPGTGNLLWQWDQARDIPSLADLPPMRFRESQPAVPTRTPVLAAPDMMVLAGDRLWFPLDHAAATRRIAIDVATGKIAAQTDNIAVNDFCQLSIGTARMACFKDNSWVDARTGAALINQWNNPIGNNQCSHHVIPAYGLTYFGPKFCACSTFGNGFRAAMDLAQAADPGLPTSSVAPQHPVERGPGQPAPTTATATWSIFLGGPRRLAALDLPAPATAPTLAWQQVVATPVPSQWLRQAGLGDALTQPVATAAEVVVAEVETGRIVALERATGRTRWSAQVPGRVWAPPALVQGLCVVSSDDGWVTALSLADGRRCWRTRAAPADRMIAIHGRIASAWPVLEGVLPAEGLLIAIAGHLDNDAAGSWVVAIDPADGVVRWSKRWRKGMPTLDAEGGLYAQANHEQDRDARHLSTTLNPLDGSERKRGQGFRMQAQAAQPLASRLQKVGSAFSPATMTSDHFLAWMQPEHLGPMLVCFAMAPEEGRLPISRVYGVPIVDPRRGGSARWHLGVGGIGRVSSVVGLRDAVLVATDALPLRPAKGKEPEVAAQAPRLRCLGLTDGVERWSVDLPAVVVHQGITPDSEGVMVSLADGKVLRFSWR